MDSEDNKSNKTSQKSKANKIGSYIAIALVAASIIIVLILLGNSLFHNTEQRTSDSDAIVALRALECTAPDPAEAFFNATYAVDVQHQVKVTYRNDIAESFFYSYAGTYASNDAASQAEARLHADYNIYMKSAAEDFTPTFSVVDDTLRIALFSPASELGSATAKMFFISPEEFTDLERYDINAIEQIYTSKGFSCKFAD